MNHFFKKEFHLKKEIEVKDITERFFKIEDPYHTDDGKGINFLMPCSDWFAVFSGHFPNTSLFLAWLKRNDDYQMESYLTYYPEENSVMMIFEFLEKEYWYSYVTIEDGPGKDYLIKMCEDVCQEDYSMSCAEFIKEE